MAATGRTENLQEKRIGHAYSRKRNGHGHAPSFNGTSRKPKDGRMDGERHLFVSLLQPSHTHSAGIDPTATFPTSTTNYRERVANVIPDWGN